MRTKLAVPLLASILIMGTLGISNFPITNASHFVDETVALENTISDIEALVDNGDLKKKDGKNLIKTLEKVIKELGKDKIDKANKEMNKFNKDTQKLIDKGLDDTLGQSLIDDVTATQDSLTNTPPTIGSISIFLIDPIFPEPIDVTGTGTGQAGPFKCIANDVTDVDGDTVTFTYSWTNSIGDVLGTEQILPFGQAVDRGFTTCEVIPFDGTDFGDPESASFFRSCPPDCGI